MSQTDVASAVVPSAMETSLSTENSSTAHSSVGSISNLASCTNTSNPTVMPSTTREYSSSQAKSIPKGFATHNASKPVPQSLGSDINAQKAQNALKLAGLKNPTLEEVNAEFAGTLLTEDKDMEYDALTGNTQRVGESIDDYFFDFDPNTPLDKTLLDSFKNFALENKMSIATAKKIAHFYDEQMQKSNATTLAKSHEEQMKMRSICANDPEIGGAKFHENVRLAKAGIRRFDNEGNLAKILDETGFGSHPEVLRFMHRVGKAFAESPMTSGAKPTRELTTAELFYPSMRK